MKGELRGQSTPSATPSGGSRVRRRWRIWTRRKVGGRALVLQHRDYAPGGVLLDALGAHGLQPTTVRVDRGEQLPEPGSIRLAVVLGSDGSVNPGGRGWSDTELDWLRDADRAGTAVLGVGLGAQALAVAMGGGVEPARQPQRAWVQVSTAVPEWIAPGPWLAWHEDAIRIPPKAGLLAHNRIGPQAFRLHRHLGVQFHPEVTPEIVSSWVARSDVTLDVQGILEATSRDFRTASAGAHRLFSAFIGSVAGSRADTAPRPAVR
jgi:GMP synthase (glutamine-hydrolysing)